MRADAECLEKRVGQPLHGPGPRQVSPAILLFELVFTLLCQGLALAKPVIDGLIHGLTLAHSHGLPSPAHMAHVSGHVRVMCNF